MSQPKPDIRKCLLPGFKGVQIDSSMLVLYPTKQQSTDLKQF